ncbi:MULTISPECIES: hypothetical protein [unclassified Candidatus Cardinium]|uniref:hypothetical protein n=1 Tax=unclassified Candidatus Cardinium TaxID=2641185 RepID=UPI001FB307E7|nr:MULTISPECIES: hypothetical protein [unclassified Candidatus Cardinium]
MLVRIIINTICLLCFMLQNVACGCNHNANKYTGQLSDVAAYAQNLDPGVKNKILDLLEDQLSLYQCFLKRIDADPELSPEELSSDQKREWNKLHLLFIDLYRMIYKAWETIQDDIDSQEKPIDLSEEALSLMQLILVEEVDFSKETQGQVTSFIISLNKLRDTIAEHYIDSFKDYIAGGDLKRFEKVVDIGKKETHEAILDFVEQFKEDEDEDDEEENDQDEDA